MPNDEIIKTVTAMNVTQLLDLQDFITKTLRERLINPSNDLKSTEDQPKEVLLPNEIQEEGKVDGKPKNGNLVTVLQVKREDSQDSDDFILTQFDSQDVGSAKKQSQFEKSSIKPEFSSPLKFSQVSNDSKADNPLPKEVCHANGGDHLSIEKTIPFKRRLDLENIKEYDWKWSHNNDKSKAQSIIRDKTLYRFLEATNNRVPPMKREFLFKKRELNDVVDDGNFDWTEESLEIFSR
ncbi:DNA endonuclease SAE2 [Nakaseomyces glabratus]|uniref:DNA endonuclease SAE2 n=1 Tax=Candida glabrata TaxID=5478 RepID=A0A0W0DPR1_CANGB|nr:DNA endonuclease SAE2 [Nakaseomyces glabratus]